MKKNFFKKRMDRVEETAEKANKIIYYSDANIHEEVKLLKRLIVVFAALLVAVLIIALIDLKVTLDTNRQVNELSTQIEKEFTSMPRSSGDYEDFIRAVFGEPGGPYKDSNNNTFYSDIECKNPIGTDVICI